MYLYIHKYMTLYTTIMNSNGYKYTSDSTRLTKYMTLYTTIMNGYKYTSDSIYTAYKMPNKLNNMISFMSS